MTTQVLDWNVNHDVKNIREGAIELQSELHKRHYDQTGPESLKSPRTFWRISILEKFQIFAGVPLSGKIMEIGAGSAWCSSILSRLPSVDQVYSLEYDPYCVFELMPKVYQRFQADESKIKRVHGSFNYMPEAKNLFDFIVSIGALHHSENLTQTMRECYHSLKPGGFLVATESCEYNGLSQEGQQSLEEKIDSNSLAKYGKITKHKDNSDHYYRLCEFESAAWNAGFNVWPYVFDLDGDTTAGNIIFTERKTYLGFKLAVHYPYFAQNPKEPVFDKLLLILQKPMVL